MQEAEAVALVLAVVEAVQQLKATLHVVAPRSKEAVHLFERLANNAHLLAAGVYEAMHGGASGGSGSGVGMGGGPHTTLEGVQRTLASARDDAFRRLLAPWYACIFTRFDGDALVGRVGSQLGDHLSDLDRGISRGTWKALKTTAGSATEAAELLPAQVVEQLGELRALPSRALFVDRQVLRLVALASVGSPQQQAAAIAALRRMPLGTTFAAAPTIDGGPDYAANREALVVQPRRDPVAGTAGGLQRLLACLPLVSAGGRHKKRAATPPVLSCDSLQPEGQQPPAPAPAQPPHKRSKHLPFDHTKPEQPPKAPKFSAAWKPKAPKISAVWKTR